MVVRAMSVLLPLTCIGKHNNCGWCCQGAAIAGNVLVAGIHAEGHGCLQTSWCVHVHAGWCGQQVLVPCCAQSGATRWPSRWALPAATRRQQLGPLA